MSTIKKLREKSGYTQESLAKKSGLSLRTIQRLEASAEAPKGHTLNVLSDVFNVEPTVLQEEFKSVKRAKESDRSSLKLINLSVLAFFLFPFGNIILPYIVWRKRSESKSVLEVGRKIIDFQILWTIVLCFLLCVSPFINLSLPSSIPLILIVFFIALTVNLIVIVVTAHSINHGNLDFLNLPIRLL